MYATVFNTTSTPVVSDAEGRTIGGGEWGTIETTSDEAKAVFDAGTLVKIDEPGKGVEVNPDAAAALQQTATTSALAKGLSALEPDVLGALAEEHAPTLVGQNKAALVAGLAARGVEPPAAAAKPAPASTPVEG